MISYFVTSEELSTQRDHIFNAVSAIITELENKFLTRVKELEEKMKKLEEKELEK